MLRSLNILFLNFTYPIPENGGTERVIDNLSYHFNKNGHICFVGFFEGIVGNNFNIKDFVDLTNKRKYDVELLDFIKKNKIHVIINFKTTLSSLIIKVLKRSKVKIISTLSYDPLNYLKVNRIQQNNSIINHLKITLGFILFKYSVNQILKISSKYVILSEYCLNDLKQIVKRKYLEKVIAINNFNSINNINYDFLSVKENHILYVGRMKDKNKRLFLLIDIWKAIIEKLNDKSWVLNMVGSGDDLNKLKEYIDKEKIQNVVFFDNSDPVNFFKKANFFLMTSIAEGFPMTLIESQKFGCVPIAFNTFASIHDIIINDFNGKIIKEGDTDAYVHAILELIYDNEKYSGLQKNAIEYVSKFDAVNILPEWNKLLEEVI